MQDKTEFKLELRNISKAFVGVQALDDVSFKLRRGTTHVLCGENGAGKSTLMKIINGFYKPDAGTILIDGKKVSIKSPVDARAHGIAMIHQELSYVPDLTLEENIILGGIPEDYCHQPFWHHELHKGRDSAAAHAWGRFHHYHRLKLRRNWHSGLRRVFCLQGRDDFFNACLGSRIRPRAYPYQLHRAGGNSHAYGIRERLKQADF